MSGWRDEIARFLTAEGKEKTRMLFDEPGEGVQVPEDEELPARYVRRHETWCQDASLSRPDDECTCAITPEMQREQNAAVPPFSPNMALIDGQQPRSASQRRRLAFAGIGASLPARTCCSTPAGTSHQGTCPNSVMCCGEYRPHVNELPPPRREPRRDDDVDRWLKRTRDSLLALGSGRDTVLAAQAVDDLLNDYRLHADTGTPLDAEVSER